MSKNNQSNFAIATIVFFAAVFVGWVTSEGFIQTAISVSLWGLGGVIVGVVLQLKYDGQMKKERTKVELQKFEAKCVVAGEEREAQRDHIAKAVSKHADTLARKRQQLRHENEYGAVDDKAWKEEIKRFFNSAIEELPGKEVRLKGNEIGSLIDKLVANHQAAMGEKLHLGFDENMDGLEYEHFCAGLLTRKGWEAQVTQGSGDQGVDVIAKKDGKKIAIQCKKYSSPVGNKAVQEAHAGKGYIDAHGAAVVTNASFTPSAVTLGQSLGVMLLHHSEIEKIGVL